MSHVSDAVNAMCSALDHCFAGYGDHRIVRTDLTAPMADVAIVDFSIEARGIEVHGAVSIGIDRTGEHTSEQQSHMSMGDCGVGV